MEKLDIIVKPKLKFSLKKCGEVVPYGITPEEKAKLAGIEENANDYTHPVTHPSSILDVVDVVNGAANKFLNERGEMVAVAHESLTDKNSEAAVQHVDTTTTKPALDASDMVAIKDSVTGKMVLAPKSNLQTDLTTVNQAITNLQNDKANKTQEAWITPTLLNNWVEGTAWTAPKYMKDNFGFVHMKGSIKNGLSGSIAFTLPIGYRPNSLHMLGAVNQNVYNVVLMIQILSGGEIKIYGTNTTHVQLDSVLFKAE